MEEPIKRRLLASGVLAPDNWLNTCTNNFRSSDEYAPDQDKLEDYIFKQWLLVNLNELRVSSFPPNLKSQHKVTLNGRYTCQITSVIDIGHSTYSQYQKLCKIDTTYTVVDSDNDTFQKKWEPKSSRTLLISISDGTQQVVALEFKRMPLLSINLIPGCKAVIKGPVTCRRGTILLEKQDHITILGGKIEALLIPNAYENILGQKLGKPVNKDARVATGEANDELLNEEQGNEAAAWNTHPQTRASSGHPNLSVPVPVQKAQPQPRAPTQRNRSPQRTGQTWCSLNQNVQQQEDQFPDDDALLSIDLDNLDVGCSASAEQRPEALPPASSSKLQVSKPTTPTYDMGIDDDLLNEFANDLEEDDFSKPELSNRIPENSKKQSTMLDKSAKRSKIVESSEKPRKSPVRVVNPSKTIDNWFKPNETVDSGNPGSSRKLNSSAKPIAHPAQNQAAQPQPRNISEMAEEDDILCLDNEGSLLEKCQNVHKVVNKPQKPPTEERQPEVERKLAHVVRDISEGKYDEATKVEVKVHILQVVESLNIRNNEWTLVVQISDGSAVLEVSLSSEAITKMMGITPDEGMKRRKEAITDVSVRKDFRSAFSRLENILKNLDCIFGVLINPGQMPCVLDIQG